MPDPPEDGGNAFHRRLHHIAPGQLRSDTAQTSGMRRAEAISGSTVGSRNLWMGETRVPSRTDSGNHHHGRSETAIYVVEGHPVFVFLDEDADGGPRETRVVTAPGDYVFVPPWVPHREENPDPAEEAVVVIARTTQDAIVVNVDDLRWVGPVATTAGDRSTAAPDTTPGRTGHCGRSRDRAMR